MKNKILFVLIGILLVSLVLGLTSFNKEVSLDKENQFRYEMIPVVSAQGINSFEVAVTKEQKIALTNKGITAPIYSPLDCDGVYCRASLSQGNIGAGEAVGRGSRGREGSQADRPKCSPPSQDGSQAEAPEGQAEGISRRTCV